jgi:quinohemoprotein ethanol dehydrogenase
MRQWCRLPVLAALCLVPGGVFAASSPAMHAEDRVLVRADGDADNWRLHGRTYDNQRFSPLTQIDKANVGQLALVHSLHTGVANSFEATPLEVDGILYIVTATDHVQAYDAVTGQQLWAWQPDKLDFTEACCGPQARGVAIAMARSIPRCSTGIWWAWTPGLES